MDGFSATRNRKIGAVLLFLLACFLLFGYFMTPKDSTWRAEDYLIGYMYLIPLCAAVLIYPRIDESSKKQARRFTIMSGILAIFFVLLIGFAALATRFHWKV